MKEKSENKKNKKTKKKSKKLIIILIVVVIIGFAIFNNTKKGAVEETIELEAVQKRTIATSIGATGTITTTDTKNVTSTLTGAEITSVNVKEGDTINIGDVICTFDTTNISDSLQLAQSSLSTSQAQANLGVQSAKRNLDDAIANKDTQVSSGQNDVNTAKKAYDDVQNQLNSAKSSLSSKQTELKNYANTYAQAQATYTAIKNEYDARETAYTNATNAYDAQVAAVQNAKISYNQYFLETNGVVNQLNSVGAIIPTTEYQAGNYATTTHQNVAATYTNAQSTLSTLEVEANTGKSNFLNYKATYENATNTFNPVKNKYETLASEVASLQGTVSSLEANGASLKSAYDKTVQAYNATVKSSDSTISSLRDSLTNSELGVSSSTQTQQSQIKTYQEQLAKGIVTSTVSGTVTNVGVKKGDIYTGATIATIEGVEEFIIEAEIDEYDIPDVQVGMKVLIKTDATREEELEGEVTYVSTSATTSAMAGATTMSISSNATYKIKIAINIPNDRLRLGMNAKLSIITEMKEDVLSVPYDSVYERDDGTHYVELAKNDEGTEKEEVNVELGLEGSYYVEVKSDKLKDGTKIILPKVDAGNSIEDLIGKMGPNAGV